MMTTMTVSTITTTEKIFMITFMYCMIRPLSQKVKHGKNPIFLFYTQYPNPLFIAGSLESAN